MSTVGGGAGGCRNAPNPLDVTGVARRRFRCSCPDFLSPNAGSGSLQNDLTKAPRKAPESAFRALRGAHPTTRPNDAYRHDLATQIRHVCARTTLNGRSLRSGVVTRNPQQHDRHPPRVMAGQWLAVSPRG